MFMALLERESFSCLLHCMWTLGIKPAAATQDSVVLPDGSFETSSASRSHSGRLTDQQRLGVYIKFWLCDAGHR